MKNMPGDFVVAAIAGLIAAALAAVAGFLAGMFASDMFLTGEASAWGGLTIGVPVALAFAVLAFAFTFRWVINYGDAA